MANRTITVKGLSTKEINKAIKKLEQYKQTLNDRTVRFVKELAKLGLETSSAVISRHTNGTGESLGSLHITTNSLGKVVSMSVVAESEAILFLEFGSGFTYNGDGSHPKAGELGMGPGTYPGQSHADDPNGWWYQGDDGQWRHSYGIKADMPMYKAWIEIFTKCQGIAKQTFRSR